MDEVLHANIFFLITALAVIVFSSILCVALFHAVKALQTLRRILDKIEEGTEVISEDMKNVRAYFVEEGFVRRLIGTLLGTRKAREPRVSRSERKRPELKVKEEEL